MVIKKFSLEKKLGLKCSKFSMLQKVKITRRSDLRQACAYATHTYTAAGGGTHTYTAGGAGILACWRGPAATLLLL